MKTRFAGAPIALMLTGLLFLTGCGGGDDDQLAVDTTMTDMDTQDVQQPLTATAELQPLGESMVSGTVTFTEADGGVRVVAQVRGLAPGEHGFHIHQTGDCSNNGEAAGGHFAPQGSPHGNPDAQTGQRHVGDLGNLSVGADSTASYDRLDMMLALSGPNSIVGKAVIVHANPDDFTSQPAGNAGPRLGCAVIQMAGGMSHDAAVTDTSAL